MADLILMVGPSGSGKSTFAAKLPFPKVSADSYFLNEKGEYKFNPADLSRAHSECYMNAVLLLERCYSVVVDNTNLTKWERERYHELSLSMLGRRAIEIWMPPLEAEELAKRNIHGLSAEQIKKQIAKMEK